MTPTTEQEFRDGLNALIRRAESNGIDVTGSYGIRAADDCHDWDVEIFPLSKQTAVTDD